jgi:uncharacterized protein YoxC
MTTVISSVVTGLAFVLAAYVTARMQQARKVINGHTKELVGLHGDLVELRKENDILRKRNAELEEVANGSSL